MTALSKSAELFVLVSKSDPKQFFAGQAKQNEWKTGYTLTWPTLIQDGIPTDHAMIELSDEAHKFVAQSFMKKDGELIPLTSGLTAQGDSAIDTFTDTIRAFKPELDDMLSEDDFENLYAEQQFDTPDLMVHTGKANTLFVPLYTAEGTMNFFDEHPELADEFKAIRFSEFVAYNRELLDGIYFGRAAPLFKPTPKDIEALRTIFDEPATEMGQKKTAFYEYLRGRGLTIAEKDIHADMLFSSYSMSNTDVARLRFVSNPHDRGVDMMLNMIMKQDRSITEFGFLLASHIKDHNTYAAYEQATTAINLIVNSSQWKDYNGRVSSALALISNMKFHLQEMKQPGSNQTYFETLRSLYPEICEIRADKLGCASFYLKDIYIKPERHEMNHRTGEMTLYLAGVNEPVMTLHDEGEITKLWDKINDFVELDYARVVIDGVYSPDEHLIEGTVPGFVKTPEAQVTFSVYPDGCTSDVFPHLDEESKNSIRKQVTQFVFEHHYGLIATVTLEDKLKNLIESRASAESVTKKLISVISDTTSELNLTGGTPKMTSLAMQAMSFIDEREKPGLVAQISQTALANMGDTVPQRDVNRSLKI